MIRKLRRLQSHRLSSQVNRLHFRLDKVSVAGSVKELGEVAKESFVNYMFDLLGTGGKSYDSRTPLHSVIKSWILALGP